MYDFIGIGSVVVDYFFEGDKRFFEDLGVDLKGDVKLKGKITFVEIQKRLPFLAKSPGGMAANTLAVLTKLGSKTSYIGVIGQDSDGDYWIKNTPLSDRSHLIRTGITTKHACVLYNHRRDRAFRNQPNPRDNSFFKK
ncbi:MAG: hypothetical protein ACD_31C00038G0001, partial [uncultured bacterium]